MKNFMRNQKKYFYLWLLPIVYFVMLIILIAAKTSYFDVYSFAIYIYGVVLLLTYAIMVVFGKRTYETVNTQSRFGTKLFLFHLLSLISFVFLSIIILFSTLEIN